MAEAEVVAKAKTPVTIAVNGALGLSNELLAAVALQQIHRVDGNCVATNTVVVEVHTFLLWFKVAVVSP